MDTAEKTINVGLLVACTPAAQERRLREFANQVAGSIREGLDRATRVSWHFHEDEAVQLESDEPRSAADFLDAASLHMVEGRYDIIVVVTDVGLVSRKRQLVAGLASPVSRVNVLSVRKLLLSPRGEPLRSLDDPTVLANAALLLQHLFGHLMGLHHVESGVMRAFTFDDTRTDAEAIAGPGALQNEAASLHEQTWSGGFLGGIAFHLMCALRHPLHVLRPLWRNRAPLLPFALPSLATAAVIPTFLLVFTAEIWDVGLNMPGSVVWIFATSSILAATCYLVLAQKLLFPREEKRLVTEHLALTNVTIIATLLLAVIGLFVMVAVLMLIIEVYIFPPQLISSWPTLEDPIVTFWDKLQLAAFISTVGVLTGALAGGLEGRKVIRHVGLFLDDT